MKVGIVLHNKKSMDELIKEAVDIRKENIRVPKMDDLFEKVKSEHEKREKKGESR